MDMQDLTNRIDPPGSDNDDEEESVLAGVIFFVLMTLLAIVFLAINSNPITSN